MTNLRADGSDVYSQDRFFRGQLDSPLDYEFAKIQPESIAVNGRMIALVAYLEGVRLPSDGPFSLILHPDKTWDLTILDLSKTQFLTHPNRSILERNYDDVYAEVTLLTLLQQKIRDVRANA